MSLASLPFYDSEKATTVGAEEKRPKSPGA
jgi:hypothetical protein